MYHWWYPDWYNGQPYQRRLIRRSSTPGPVADSPDIVAGPDADHRLLEVVAAALIDDPAVTGGQVDLDVQNGVVILDGEFGTEDARTAVVHRVWSIPGVADVCNALTVTDKPGNRR